MSRPVAFRLRNWEREDRKRVREGDRIKRLGTLMRLDMCAKEQDG